MEGVLAVELPLPALTAGIDAIAADLGLGWEGVRGEIADRLPAGFSAERRATARRSDDWDMLADAVGEAPFREAVRLALKGTFRVKTPWIARLLAERAVAQGAMPASLRRVIEAVTRTITAREAMTIDLDEA